jgi:hypothetical protein
VETPNPTATGMSVYLRISATRADMSVVSELLTRIALVGKTEVNKVYEQILRNYTQNSKKSKAGRSSLRNSYRY